MTDDSHTGLWSPKQGASLSRRTHSQHDLGKWPARMSRTRSPVTPTRRRTYQGWTMSFRSGSCWAGIVDRLVDAMPLVHLIVAILP